MNKAASRIAKIPGELQELADAACNGTLTDAHRKQLEQLLGQDRTSQLAYLSYLDIHAQLHWEGRCGTEPEHDAIAGDPQQLAASRCEKDDQVALSATAGRRGTARRRTWWAVTAAAAVVLIAALGFGLSQLWREETLPQGIPMATWVRGLDAQWEDARLGVETVPPSAGDPLRVGDYRLTHGLAEIRFESGAVVTLKAPAQIQLLDFGLARLNSGRLVAGVPPEAAGFMIQTPVGDIVDRGTEFAVEVDENGQTFVQVYEGDVEAGLMNRDGDGPDDCHAPRRLWPLAAIRIPAEGSSFPQPSPFEPERFSRTFPERPSVDLPPATSARISLDNNPDATAHVKAFVAGIETAPAEVVQVGTVYENWAEVNDFTTAELRVLIPAMLDLLDDERPLAPGAAASGAVVRRRVADRAESVLEFAAGFRPEGEPRQQVWRDWWSGAQSESRTAWFAGRTDILRERLERWQAGAGYPENLYALNLLEIAARSRDREVVPILLELLRDEIPAAHETELSLAAVVDCIGRLGGPKLVPGLVELARRLNNEQKAIEPEKYSSDHARRSSTLRSFAATLDRLAGAELAAEALCTIGPAALEMYALDEDAFAQWLEAARLRAGAPDPGSPSDLPADSAKPRKP